MATLSMRPIRDPLWDPNTRRFNGPVLRGKIVARGFTVREFASVAGRSPACLYNAVKSQRVSDRTTVAIVKALERFKPLISATDVGRGMDGW